MAYVVRSAYDIARLGANFSIYIATEPKNIKTSLDGFEEEIRKIKEIKISEEELFNAKNNLFGKYHEYKKQFIIKHIPSLMSDALAGLYAPEFETSELDSLLNVLGERQPQYPAYKRLIALAIGHQFIDFTAPDTIGNSIKASDIVNKNKCTLIDFWASWCRPCREEMPYLLDAYAKYHGRGFEIIGVSLDAKRNQWVNAINSMQLPWINVCDSATYNSSVAINYCINAIPYNYLIDDEGKIVAKNLRGDALSIALSNIFK